MSAKNEKKGGSRLPLLVVLIVLVCAVVAAVLISGQKEPAPPNQTVPPKTTAPQTNPTDDTVVPTEPSVVPTETTTIPTEPDVEYTEHATRPTEQADAPTEPQGLDLGSGILIMDYARYTGPFLEDRSDAFVSDVLAIQVTNTGEEYIQTMDILLSDGETVARFSLSTLFPGDTVIVPELNRMPFADAPEFTEFSTESVALFDGHPGMCADRIAIQCLDGVMNITNISGEDITEDIFVYYKNYIDGVYCGGITYRLRLTGGLKAGEIRQGSAAHFDRENSRIVFVTCGG